MAVKKTAEGGKRSKGKSKRKKGGWGVAVVVLAVVGLLLVCGGVAAVVAFRAFNLGDRIDAIAKGGTPQELAVRYLPNKLMHFKSIAFDRIRNDPAYQKLRAGFYVPDIEDVNAVHSIPAAKIERVTTGGG